MGKSVKQQQPAAMSQLTLQAVVSSVLMFCKTPEDGEKITEPIEKQANVITQLKTLSYQV